MSTPYAPALKKGRVKEFLRDIGKQTDIALSFSEAVIDTKKRVQLNGKEHTVGDVLRSILQGFPVVLRESGDKILIVPVGDEPASTPRQITLNGFVRDSSSGEILIGAPVYIASLGTGTFTNQFGFYSLTVPAGSYQVSTSYLGYDPATIQVSGYSNLKHDLLIAQNSGMSEVSVTDKIAPPLDHSTLRMEQVNFYTGLLGDNDVLKALQHLPGVQPSADGTSNLIVRGGDPGQNLNLLDGVPLYYTDHFYGISSIYNTDALKAVDFYSGSFPARYGGRLSAITDVNTKDGDMERIRGVARVGLLNGSLSLESPLVKNRSSAIVTARRSWLDLLWRPFDNTVGVNFYDVNAKLNYVINNSNRLFLSVYNGRDLFRVDDNSADMQATWGNSFAALKWNCILSPKIFLNTSFTLSSFRYELKDVLFSQVPDSTGGTELYKGVSSIKEQSVRSQLFWYVNRNHKIELGAKYAHGVFAPGSVTFTGEGGIGTVAGINPAESFHSNELMLYAEDEWKLSPAWKLRLGLHWAGWLNDDFSYSNLQPRLFISYVPNARYSFHGSASRMTQFLHLVSNNASGFPTDFWLPSTARIKPETSILGNVGGTMQLDTKSVFGLELYYKTQENLVTYKSNRSIFDNPQSWEQTLTQGRGWSYGLEVTARRQSGKCTLMLAYTLSWSFRQYDQLNYGKSFPYRYDRRHNLHLDGLYQLRKGIDVHAGWTYMSGEAMTLPDQAYPDLDNNLLNNSSNFGFTYNSTSWNNYRLPAVHRLDISVDFTRRKPRYERTITVGLYNVYGRRNIVGTSLSQDEHGAFTLEGYSIARFIPALSYRIQF